MTTTPDALALATDRNPIEWYGERAMRKAVCEWLVSIGYVPVFEVWNCDIVAGKWSERTGRAKPSLLSAIAVELKLDDVAGVIKQCKAARLRYDLAFAAMPEERVDRMREDTIGKFVEAGVGLLEVGESVSVKIEPLPGESLWSGKTANTLWRRRHEWSGRLTQVRKLR